MESRRRNKIIVILGPTSSGKSDIAIRLAKQFDGEIISADSRQVYRGMDIGTGKIEPEQARGITHHALSIVSPKTDYNVSKFKKSTEKIITEILSKGKLPIICGGTGFWIKSIVDNIDFPEVKPDWELRKKLETQSAEKLFSQLEKLDPERAQNIDAKNKVRLIRAIEICKSIGKVPPIPNQNEKHQQLSKTTPHDFLQIGIDISKEKLHQNIKKRLTSRWKKGMIEEVQKIKNKYKLSWKKIQSFGLGYFWIPLYLQNKIPLKELREKVFLAEKDYAKRQMTWFKKDQRIKWLKNYPSIKKEVAVFLKKQNPPKLS